jgi:2-C-methyl-D-erythritol 4-phosphate cytidylyltransferase
MMQPIPFWGLFLAGGSGTRMGTSIPKQYLLLQGKPLALYSFETFLKLPEMHHCVIVCDPAYQSLFQDCVAYHKRSIDLHFALPGQQRQDSVFNGIQKVTGNPLVCIHDMARPLINAQLIRQVVLTADKWEAAVVGVRMKSTIKICDETQFILETPKREALWEIQTPQVIRLNLLKEGFSYSHLHHLTVTDDASLVECLGKPVKVVEGSYSNIKVTTPEDLTLVKQLLTPHVLS